MPGRHRIFAAWVGLATIAMAGAMGCSHGSAESYLAAGDKALQSNQLATAEQNYQAAVKAAPNNPRTHLALGNLYVFEHNYPPAEREFLAAIRLAPRGAIAHAALARLYAAQNNLNAAENQWRAAIALDPAQSGYYEELAALLMRENRPADAERALRVAVGLAPQNAHLHLELANTMNAQPDQGAMAEAEYAQVRKLDPSLLPSSTPATPVEGAGAAGAASAAATPTPAAAQAPAVRPLNKTFLLTHDSPVYVSPDETSAVVAHVHRRRFVHVTGLSGNWLRIRMRNGTVGFIPASAAE
jgi:tetratricopeptide (TPR) repeat protein